MPTVPLSHIRLKTNTDSSNLSAHSKKRKRLWMGAAFFSGSIIFSLFFLPIVKPLIFPSPLVHLKHPHPDFIGRKEILDSLYEICIKKPKTNIPIVVLCGEEGVGKSEIASTFANQQLKKFSLIYWIDGSSQENYNKSYGHLAELLNIPLAHQESPLETVRKVHQYLERETTWQPWLLIFDNAEKALEIPQQGQGVIIVTTRNYLPWHLFPSIEVGSFSEEEACQLLEKITQKKQNPYRRLLAQELDYYPLVLNLSAHYIAETPGMSEEEYLRLLSQNKINLIGTMPIDSRYPNHLLSSWEITANQLFEKHPETLHWLHFCSYLCPHGIPKSWIDKWLNQSKKNEDAFSRKMKVDEILRILVNQSLAYYYDKNTDTFFLHRLKQEVFQQDRHFQPETQMEVLQFLLSFIGNLQTKDGLREKPELWAKLDQWGPHAEWFLNHYRVSSHPELILQLQNHLNIWKCIKSEEWTKS